MFFYIGNYNNKPLLSHGDECFLYIDIALFCEHCGELYLQDSICCLRRSYELIKREWYTSLDMNCSDYYYLIPFIALFYHAFNAFPMIMNLRKSGEDIHYKKEPIYIRKKRFLIIIIVIMIIYTIIFFLPYMFLYLIHVIWFIKLRKLYLTDINTQLHRY